MANVWIVWPSFEWSSAYKTVIEKGTWTYMGILTFGRGRVLRTQLLQCQLCDIEVMRQNAYKGMGSSMHATCTLHLGEDNCDASTNNILLLFCF